MSLIEFADFWLILLLLLLLLLLFADNIGKIENATTDVEHACSKLEVLTGITHTNNIYDTGPIKRVRLLTVLFCLHFVFIFV